jgi:hypothetical protein
MAEVLCVYREVKILKQAAAASKKKRPSDAVAMVSLLAGIDLVMDYFNRDPVVHTWTHKLDKTA